MSGFNQIQSNKIIPQQKKYKLISQGAYGCIYYPGPPCPNKKDADDYITKIQKRTDTSQHETSIGKKIKTIKLFKEYFAPVVDTCEIDLSTIDENELNKCDFLNTNDPSKPITELNYESNKIKYVGKTSLADYLKTLLENTKKSNTFITKFINSQLIILEGIDKLSNIGIVHFDLKENNIICRNTGRPILIDFGLSIDITAINEPTFLLKDAFFVYGPDYGPWCIDICFLTYMSNELDPNQTAWTTKTVTIIEMEKVIDDYINQNSAIKELLTGEEQTKFKIKQMEYFKQFDGKTWKAVLDELLKCNKSWDNYGIAVLYLNIIKDLLLDQYIIKYQHLKKYQELLKQVVMSSPNERLTARDTITKINSIFSSISKIEHKKFKSELQTDVKNPENYKKRRQNIATHKLHEIQSETHIYSNIIA